MFDSSTANLPECTSISAEEDNKIEPTESLLILVDPDDIRVMTSGQVTILIEDVDGEL